MRKQSIFIALLLFSLAPIAQAEEGGLSLSGEYRGRQSIYLARLAPDNR